MSVAEKDDGSASGVGAVVQPSGPFHARDELKAAVGQDVMVAPSRALGGRWLFLHGAVGTLVSVRRTRGVFEHGERGRCWIPLSWLVLPPHPLFEDTRRYQVSLYEAVARTRLARVEAARKARLERQTLNRTKPRMEARLRDSQRARVYAWGNEQVRPLVEAEELSLIECSVFLREVVDDLPHRCFVAIGVRDGRGSSSARWVRTGERAGLVHLPAHARGRRVMLHEVAHALCGVRFESNHGTRAIQPHGPEFVRTYIELLIRFLGLPREVLEGRARGTRLKVGDPSSCAFAVVEQPFRRLTPMSKARNER